VVELEGIRRTQKELAQADHILLIVDDSQGITQQDQKILADLPADKPLTVIRNKIDRSGHESGETVENGRLTLLLSAKTGDGIELLRQHLFKAVGFHPEEEGVFIARRRHLDALGRARQSIVNGYDCLTGMGAGELLAEELRQAQNALGEITGTFTTEDLLDHIFSSFCIGK
jgi:tRNA modification GTPase